ncbi:MAG: hypothetical protein GX600_09900, partial [Dehalococcoidia bacterium]|nr:hypothetical protein [Dehalococcoidia bacterium]
MAFSPDGKQLASGGWDGAIWLYDVDKRRATHRLMHGRPESGMDLHPIVHLAYDPTPPHHLMVVLQDVGGPTGTPGRPVPWVYSLNCWDTRSGTLLDSESFATNAEVRVWSFRRDGGEFGGLQEKDGEGEATAEMVRCIIGEDGTLTLREPLPRLIPEVPDGMRKLGLTLSPDWRMAAATFVPDIDLELVRPERALPSARLLVCDTTNGSIVHSAERADGTWWQAVEFSSDGHHLAASGTLLEGGRQLSLWRVEHAEWMEICREAVHEHWFGAHGMIVFMRDTGLWLADCLDWERGPSFLGQLPMGNVDPAGLGVVVCSPAGNAMAMGDEWGNVGLLTALKNGGTSYALAKGMRWTAGAALSVDGRYLVSLPESGNSLVFDLAKADNASVARLTHQRFETEVGFVREWGLA